MVSICVYVDPKQRKPVAIVVPDEAMLRNFSEQRTLAPPSSSLASLIDSQIVVSAVHGEMLSVGKRNGLSGIELIQGLVLVSEEWTPENVYQCITWSSD